MSYNGNTTKRHKQHLTTQKDVPLGDVCAITNKVPPDSRKVGKSRLKVLSNCKICGLNTDELVNDVCELCRNGGDSSDS